MSRISFEALAETIFKIVPNSGGYNEKFLKEQFSSTNLGKILLRLRAGHELTMDEYFAGKQEEKSYPQLPERFLLLAYVLDNQLAHGSANENMLKLYNVIAKMIQCFAGSLKCWVKITAALHVADEMMKELDSIKQLVLCLINDNQTDKLILYAMREIFNGMDILLKNQRQFIPQTQLKRINNFNCYRNQLDQALREHIYAESESTHTVIGRTSTNSNASFALVQQVGSNFSSNHGLSGSLYAFFLFQCASQFCSYLFQTGGYNQLLPLRIESVGSSQSTVPDEIAQLPSLAQNSTKDKAIKLKTIAEQLDKIRDKLSNNELDLVERVLLKMEACSNICMGLELLKNGNANNQIRTGIFAAWQSDVSKVTSSYQQLLEPQGKPLTLQAIQAIDDEMMCYGTGRLNELRDATYQLKDFDFLKLLDIVGNFIKGIFNQSPLSKAERYINRYQKGIFSPPPCREEGSKIKSCLSYLSLVSLS